MDIAIEGLRATGQTNSNRSPALRFWFLVLSLSALPFFLDGCAAIVPKALRADHSSDAPNPPITTLSSQQESDPVRKEPEPPSSKPASELPHPVPTVTKPILASPKAAESTPAAPTSPPAHAVSHVKPTVSQPPEPESPIVQANSGTPPTSPTTQNALIFKGPSHTIVPKRQSGHPTLMWLWICLPVFAAAIGITLFLRRGAKSNRRPNGNRGQATAERLALEGAPEPPEAALGE